MKPSRRPSHPAGIARIGMLLTTVFAVSLLVLVVITYTLLQEGTTAPLVTEQHTASVLTSPDTENVDVSTTQEDTMSDENQISEAEEVFAVEEKQTVSDDVDVPEATEAQVVSCTTPSLAWETVHKNTVPTLVNILCGSGAQSPISGATGTGVIIDSRGVILTNAHVAQYVLLENHPTVQAACVVRTGSPARATYTAELIALPKAWVAKHAADIRLEYPTGTGENDWALLYITGTVDGSPLPDEFPFLPIDARHAITQTNDTTLLAAYPAGFLGSASLRRDLWSVSTIATVQRLYTFTEQLVDILSFGGTIVAQGGASGGAVVNQWGNLVGIIVTSSTGATTAERDLRAVTMSHIDASIAAETGLHLHDYLESGNFSEKVDTFSAAMSPALLGFYTF